MLLNEQEENKIGGNNDISIQRDPSPTAAVRRNGEVEISQNYSVEDSQPNNVIHDEPEVHDHSSDDVDR